MAGNAEETSAQASLVSAASEQVSKNVQTVATAKGAAEISQNIVSVADSGRGTSNGASDTQTASGELERMAAELQGLVGQFNAEKKSIEKSGKSFVPGEILTAAVKRPPMHTSMMRPL